jgi:hypothetical protein
VDIHVEKDDVGISCTYGQPQVFREEQGNIRQSAIQSTMSFPEFAIILVFGLVIWIRLMQMGKVSAKETSHENDAGKRRERGRAVGCQGLIQRHGLFLYALVECLIG